MNMCTDCTIHRFEWRLGDRTDPLRALEAFLRHHGFRVDDCSMSDSLYAAGHRRAVLLIGAAAAATAAGGPAGPPSPAPAVPDVAAVVTSPCTHRQSPPPATRPAIGPWQCSWTDADHAAAVTDVRARIARGQVYQVNIVGHRSATLHGDPTALLTAVATLPGASHGGLLTGDGWAIATATPECLLTVARGTARTRPIKGTRPATPDGHRALLADPKERAEHIMIVDLARNDLGRLATPGTVRVENLYTPRDWSGLWQAESTVAARLRPHVSLADLLRAVLPGGSVTGAPKHSALRTIDDLEPVGRGPAMGAFGIIAEGRLDLGLTIRTLAAEPDRLHLWAGGGITWGSDPDREVAEAHAKAAPILAALHRATRPEPAPQPTR